MSFDIHQRVTIPETGRIDREAANVWSHRFTELFRTSPEGLVLAEQGQEYHWVAVLLESSVDICGLTPAQLTADDLRELLDVAFPLELYGEDGDPELVIRELRAVFQFLHREYALPNALECLVALDDGVIAKLREDTLRTAAEIEAEAALLPDDLPFPDSMDTATELDITDDELAELAFAMDGAEDT